MNLQDNSYLATWREIRIHPVGEFENFLLSIDEISLRREEVLGVYGPSGSGKSTLLRMLAGLAERDRQLNVSYSLDYNEVERLTASELRRAWVPQEPQSSFDPNKTILTQLNDVIYHNDAISRGLALDNLLEQVGLSHLHQDLEKYPAEFSGGQLQRFCLLAALAVETDILLLDEPGASLDNEAKQSLYALIRKLAKVHKIAVVWVSHERTALKAFADRTMHLSVNSEMHSKYEQMKQLCIKNIQDTVPWIICQSLNTSYSHSIDKNLWKSDVNISLSHGNVYGLSGPSGIGKTTLAKILSLQRLSFNGTIQIDGRCVSSMTKSELRIQKQRIQYIYQDALESLNPAYTASQILNFAVKDASYRNKGALKDLMAMTKKVGITESILEKPVVLLSGGERQRVNLIRALLFHPEFLILDEPLSGIDEIDKYDLLLWLTSLFKERNMTVLWVSHDESELEIICGKRFSLIDHLS